ncbi:SH3 domain-containing protein [Candidatus Halobeggiatoa sp. HSG11]|nr:SH3 domain-containing protein [Candidatus Halobeggiatoa sp. HSG11]
MNVKQLLVILCCISLLPSFVVAETFGIVIYKGKTQLRVRKAPSTNAKEINGLPYGEVVKILTKPSSSWHKIEYRQGLRGYSFGNYGKNILPLPYEQYDACVKVVAESLNVRTGPAYHDRKDGTPQYFRVINEIAEGSILQVLGRIAYRNWEGNNVVWFRIQDANMQTGHYINGNSKYVLPANCQNIVNYSNYFDEELEETEESEEMQLEYRERKIEKNPEETFYNCNIQSNAKSRNCIENICKTTSITDEEYKSCKYACEKRRATDKEECNYRHRN